jgi:hypothetical protein
MTTVALLGLPWDERFVDAGDLAKELLARLLSD